ncbi:hypothetical protein G6L30_17315 [Agrobacterium rhizogenes]|nr:hypothetical protein [Rhizobium rhizogenes]
MPEKMKIYNKDGSSAEVDAVDGARYLADPKISQEWAAKPWAKADADTAAKAKADADAKAKADADAAAAKAKADADAKA